MKIAKRLLFSALALYASLAFAEGPFHFPNGRRPGDVDHVVAELKVGGDILEMRGGKVNKVPMGGTAKFVYAEKTLEAGEKAGAPSRTIRKYEGVEASIRVGDDGLKPTLRPEVSVVAATVDDRASILFSPQGRLSRDELELIDILGNSLLIDRLLPSAPLKVGQTWEPSVALLAQLFGLDAIGQSDVQCELVEVTDAVARFQMTGSLSATIHGIATRLQLKCKYRYDRQSRRIDWFALSMKEVRAVAPVAEGFDVVAQVRVRIVPNPDYDGFDQELLDGLSFESRDEVELLSYKSQSSDWRLTHSRKWFVIRDDPDLVMLRFVKQGELLAQCSISPLPQVPVDKLRTLEHFREDVRRALGARFERFVSVGQGTNEARYRVYRVIVSGTAEAELKQATAKVPIEWRYYLIADEHGRRVALALTVEAALAERLGNADRELVDSLRFAEPAPAAK